MNEGQKNFCTAIWILGLLTLGLAFAIYIALEAK